MALKDRKRCPQRNQINSRWKAMLRLQSRLMQTNSAPEENNCWTTREYERRLVWLGPEMIPNDDFLCSQRR